MGRGFAEIIDDGDRAIIYRRLSLVIADGDCVLAVAFRFTPVVGDSDATFCNCGGGCSFTDGDASVTTEGGAMMADGGKSIVANEMVGIGDLVAALPYQPVCGFVAGADGADDGAMTFGFFPVDDDCFVVGWVAVLVDGLEGVPDGVGRIVKQAELTFSILESVQAATACGCGVPGFGLDNGADPVGPLKVSVCQPGGGALSPGPGLG